VSWCVLFSRQKATTLSGLVRDRNGKPCLEKEQRPVYRDEKLARYHPYLGYESRSNACSREIIIAQALCLGDKIRLIIISSTKNPFMGFFVFVG